MDDTPRKGFGSLLSERAKLMTRSLSTFHRRREA